jgi:hypothetical protein
VALEAPGETMAKVVVHQFSTFDPNLQVWDHRVSRRMATLEAIAGVRGKVIEDTGVEIDANLLDPVVDGMTPVDFRP